MYKKLYKLRPEVCEIIYSLKDMHTVFKLDTYHKSQEHTLKGAVQGGMLRAMIKYQASLGSGSIERGY